MIEYIMSLANAWSEKLLLGVEYTALKAAGVEYVWVRENTETDRKVVVGAVRY